MLMKKNFPWLFCVLLLGLLVIPAAPALAGGAEWYLTWNSNGSISEKVTVDGANLPADKASWKSSVQNGQTIYERETRDWASYQQLTDRLPLTVENKNFFLWEITSIKSDKGKVPTSGLFAQVADLEGSNLVIKVPGVIQKSSVKLAAEDQAVFRLADFKSGPLQPYLQVVVIEGLWLGLALFILAFIIIMLYYLGRVRRVNRLIEDEYSLEKALEQLEKEEKENADNEKDQDEKKQS